jgi:threonine dehydrogenase-like Zn-dependent dehydrogenase
MLEGAPWARSRRETHNTRFLYESALLDGTGDVRIETVPDPPVIDRRDAIVKVMSTAICGSDLHLLDGYIPTMEKGDVRGHEFMGGVVELGPDVKNLLVGERVIAPFTIACGECSFCKKGFTSCCDRSNPNEAIARKAMGQSPSGLFGYSQMLDGFPGGQAEYVRVPYADVGPFKVPDGLEDERVLFSDRHCSHRLQAAENAEIEQGDTVAVWGCGPVGQFSIQSAWMLGAGRVIAIDEVPERLAPGSRDGRTETIDFSKGKKGVYERLQTLTKGRGPDRCIDAVGTEAAGHGSIDAVLER